MNLDLNLLTNKEIIELGIELKLKTSNFNELLLNLNDNYQKYLEDIDNDEYSIIGLKDLNIATSLYNSRDKLVLLQGCCYLITPANYNEEVNFLFGLPEVDFQDKVSKNTENSNFIRAKRIIRIVKSLSINNVDKDFNQDIKNIVFEKNQNNYLILDSNSNIFYKNDDELLPLSVPHNYLNDKRDETNNIIKISGSNGTYYALDKYGYLYGWGVNNDLLGGKSEDYVKNPKKLMFCKTFIKKFYCGNNHLLAIDDNNGLYGWGDNKYNQLLYRRKEYLNPVFLDVNISVEHAICGDTFNIILDKNGILYSWGDNTYGQLGDGTYTSKNTPIIIKIPNKIIKLVGGQYHVIALDKDNNLYVWGRNDMGQLGINKNTIGELNINENEIGGILKVNIPIILLNDKNIKNLYSGDNHSMILYNDGSVLVSGDNRNKQLHPNDINQIDTFSKLELEPIENIFTNNNRTFLKTKKGDIINFNT